MKEKEIAVGKFVRRFVVLPVVVTVVGLWLLLIVIPYLAGFASTEFYILGPLLGVAIITSWIVFFYADGCALTVTDKRVCGRASFGRRVDLPIDAVSAIGTTGLSGITIATSSGRIAFLLVANREEIYDCMNGLLISRQSSVSAQTIVTQEVPFSSADELKKYKELLDKGVISQEEFDTKKKQLLGL